MSFLSSPGEFLRRLENFLVAFLLAVIALAVFFGVFFRYVLKDPLIWSEELSLICFAWLIFIGAAICSREKMHMRIDVFSRLFSLRKQKILDRWTLYLMAILSGVLIYFGLRHALYAFPTKTTALGLSWTYVFLSVPVGASLMLFHFLQELLAGRSAPQIKETQ